MRKKVKSENYLEDYSNKMDKVTAQVSERWVIIDLLRIFAVVVIVMTHLSMWFGSRAFGDIASIFGIYDVSFADIALTILLLISGLVLELKYGGEKINYFRFVKERCLKVYPIYFFSLVVSVVIFFLIKIFTGGGGDPFYSYLNFQNVICSILGICAYFGLWGGPFLNTGWFIGLILVLYLLFPLISVKMRNNSGIVLFGLLMVSVVVRLMLKNEVIHLGYSSMDWFPLARIFEFGFGIYLGKKLNPEIWRPLSIKLSWVFVVLFLSRLSFPVFLLHFPLIIVIEFLTMLGFSLEYVILVYLLIVFFTCSAVLFVGNMFNKAVQIRRKSKENI